ncbi:unnamed protein product [Blepharisma stoltei]|uniref:Uncharacterized protein n=1 Tax=Blepharisma stoltei TaxID=1481888 RepID=A0AAU9J1P6_9CILI|nr:unnamed protein product [Blepharisma stoltei]
MKASEDFSTLRRLLCIYFIFFKNYRGLICILTICPTEMGIMQKLISEFSDASAIYAVCSALASAYIEDLQDICCSSHYL